MTRRQRLIRHATRYQRTSTPSRAFKLRILADEPIVEWGPEVVHGPGDVR